MSDELPQIPKITDEAQRLLREYVGSLITYHLNQFLLELGQHYIAIKDVNKGQETQASLAIDTIGEALSTTIEQIRNGTAYEVH